MKTAYRDGARYDRFLKAMERQIDAIDRAKKEQAGRKPYIIKPKLEVCNGIPLEKLEFHRTQVCLSAAGVW